MACPCGQLLGKPLSTAGLNFGLARIPQIRPELPKSKRQDLTLYPPVAQGQEKVLAANQKSLTTFRDPIMKSAYLFLSMPLPDSALRAVFKGISAPVI